MYAIRSYYELGAETLEQIRAEIAGLDVVPYGALQAEAAQLLERGGRKQSIERRQVRARAEETLFRITSYNVCYTKLLRQSVRVLQVPTDPDRFTRS